MIVHAPVSAVLLHVCWHRTQPLSPQLLGSKQARPGQIWDQQHMPHACLLMHGPELRPVCSATSLAAAIRSSVRWESSLPPLTM